MLFFEIHANRAINNLEAADNIKGDCRQLLKKELDLKQKLEEISQLDEKISRSYGRISNLCTTADEFSSRQTVIERAGLRIFYVMKGIGAIMLCPLSWLCGVVDVSAQIIRKPYKIKEVVEGGVMIFFIGPFKIARWSFHDAVATKESLKRESEQEIDSKQNFIQKRASVLSAIQQEENEMLELSARISNTIQVPNQLLQEQTQLSQAIKSCVNRKPD